ncbi:Ig-like domain-containing protein [Latilactobacillus sakei]
MMKRSIKAVTLGLLFSSVLGTTISPQTVFAANQKPQSISEKSILQKSENDFQQFAVDYLDRVTSYTANQLVDGHISTKTTQLKIDAHLAGIPFGNFALYDSTGTLVYDIGLTMLNGDTIQLPANLLKAGESYTLRDTNNQDNSGKLMTFTVVAGITIAAPKLEQVTNHSLSVTGTAEPNSELYLTIGGDPYNADVDEQGHFTLTLNRRYAAGEPINAYTLDMAGNRSELYSASVQTAVEIAAPTINKVTDQDTVVTGTGIPGATIYVSIFENGNEIKSKSTVERDGTYEVHFANPGIAGATVEAYQELDGVVSPSAKVMIQHSAPLLVDEVKTSNTKVTGTAMPYASVYLVAHTASGEHEFYGTVKDNGIFSVDLQGEVLTPGTLLTIVVTNPDGSQQTKEVTVMPKDPIINPVHTGDTSISGTVDPNATVNLMVGDVPYVIRADDKGHFDRPVATNLLTFGTKITAYAVSEGLHSITVKTTVIAQGGN